MNDIYLFQCPARAFIEERVFVNSGITWSKLMGLISARLNLLDPISHLTLAGQDICCVEEFVQACGSYSPANLESFLVHIGEPRSRSREEEGNEEVGNREREEELPQSPAGHGDTELKGARHHPSPYHRGSGRGHPDERGDKKIVVNSIKENISLDIELENGYNDVEEVSYHDPSSHFTKQRIDRDKMSVKSEDLKAVRVLHPHSDQLLTLWVSPSCDWDQLKSAFNSQLIGQEEGSAEDDLNRGYSWTQLLLQTQWKLVLQDDDGDIVSPVFDTTNKFWKYHKLQLSDESLTLSVVFPPGASDNINSTTAATALSGALLTRPKVGGDNLRDLSAADSIATDKESSFSSPSSSVVELQEETTPSLQSPAANSASLLQTGQVQGRGRHHHRSHPPPTRQQQQQHGPVHGSISRAAVGITTPSRPHVQSTANNSTREPSFETPEYVKVMREHTKVTDDRLEPHLESEDMEWRDASSTPADSPPVRRKRSTSISTSTSSREGLGQGEGEGEERIHPVLLACAGGDLSQLKALLGKEEEEENDDNAAFDILCHTKCAGKEYTALHYACENGHMNCIEWLLRKFKAWDALDAALYAPDDMGYTPLHLLCSEGNVAALRFLRREIMGDSQPLHLNALATHNDTSLVHVCVLHGRHDALIWLFQDNSRRENAGHALEDSLEVNVVNGAGACPLHIACALSDIRMARLLVDRGAFVNVRDAHGNSPLMVACFQNDLIMAQWLYENGAKYSQPNRKGFSALHVASRKGNISMARWLISRGLGQYAAADSVSVVPSPMDEAHLHEHLVLYNFYVDLQQAEEEVFQRHEGYFSALQSGDVNAMMRALEEGVDVDCRFPSGDHALHVVCTSGHLEAAEALVSRLGAQVDATQKYTGMTPLHVACQEDQVLLSQWLLQRGGANPMSRCYQGNSVFHYLSMSGNLRLLQWFLELGSLDVNACNIDGCSALYVACQHGFLEVAKMLRDHGASNCSRNGYGMSLLHVAAEHGQAEVLSWLLEEEEGGEEELALLLQGQNFNGCTALYLACAGGHVEVAKRLYGECPSAVDIPAKAVEDRNTPLHAACKQGHLEVVMWLAGDLGLDLGLLHHLNGSSQTPLEVASEASREEVVAWLDELLGDSYNHDHDHDRDHYDDDHHDHDHHDDGGTGFVESYEDDFGMVSHEHNKNGKDCDRPAPTSSSSSPSSSTRNTDSSPGGFASFFSCVPVRSLNRTLPTGTTTASDQSSAGGNRGRPHASPSPTLVTSSEVSAQTLSGAQELLGVLEVGGRGVQKFLTGRNEDEVTQLLNCLLPERGLSPFHYACFHQDPSVLRTILKCVRKNQLEVNAHDSDGGNTPLHTLCSHDSRGELSGELILLLLGFGADVSAKNKAGDTPLHLLCWHSDHHSSAKVMQHIIELPRTVLPHLDLTVKSSSGLTLMHAAVQAENLPLVRLLCQYCQSLVNSRSETHITPLHMAVMSGHTEIAEVLLVQFQAFVNARDDEGMTALLYACRYGQLRLAKLMVKHGANILVEEDDEGTGLHMACRAGDFAMTKWLVRQGLRPDCENNDGVTPIQLVRQLQVESEHDHGEQEEEEEEEEEGNMTNAYARIADWLSAWSLADTMGLSVEEVLAEVNKEKSMKSKKSPGRSSRR